MQKKCFLCTLFFSRDGKIQSNMWCPARKGLSAQEPQNVLILYSSLACRIYSQPVFHCTKQIDLSIRQLLILLARLGPFAIWKRTCMYWSDNSSWSVICSFNEVQGSYDCGAFCLFVFKELNARQFFGLFFRENKQTNLVVI